MRLRADVDGCKQTNKQKKGKEKRNGMDLPQVVGMSAQFEHCLNTVFELCQTRTNCSNTVRTHGNECITCPNTVRTVFRQHAKQRMMFKHFEQCSNSTPLHGGLFEHGSNTWKRMYNMSEHCPNSVQILPNKNKLFEKCSNTWKQV